MLLHSADSVWAVDPGSALSLLTGALVYSVGVHTAWRRSGAGRGISRVQVSSFVAGYFIVAVALLSPLDAMADELFSAHMTQHVLLTSLAPPLLVVGAPELAALWSLPASLRHRLTKATRRTRWLSAAWVAITTPVSAWALHFIAVWGWHDPRLYDLALRNDAAHAAEHLSFLGTGMLVWWRIVHPRGVARTTGYGIGLITLFATAAQEGALGALFTISHRVFYPIQAAGAAAHGLTPLEDQQLAGLVMWIPGGVVYLIGMSVLFMRWLDSDARRDRRYFDALSPRSP